ncbi:MAG: CapA family protein [Deltaproteobacteria bacterium]|nr:CapA family protein [Deltaproteobacteria bacterium]
MIADVWRAACVGALVGLGWASPGHGLARPDADAAHSRPKASQRGPTEDLTLTFVGDVVLGEYVRDRHRSFAGPQAPGPAFEGVATLLQSDVVVGNLESPVMSTIPSVSPLRWGHRFGAARPTVQALASAGFSAVSLANNHANDLGRAGLEQGPALLRDHGVVPVGAARRDGSPFVVQTLEAKGWRIGLLAATTWLNHQPQPDEPTVPVVRLAELASVLGPVVEQARDDHDLMVVLLHWGREGKERPDDAQRAAAHDLVDAGADLVIGHHPHVLQGVEHYRGALIAYSLGNFLFPARRPEYRRSAVLRVDVSAGSSCIRAATVHAIALEGGPGHAPKVARGTRRRSVHDRMRRLGRSLLTPLRRDDDDLVWTSPGCPDAAPP